MFINIYIYQYLYYSCASAPVDPRGGQECTVALKATSVPGPVGNQVEGTVNSKAPRAAVSSAPWLRRHSGAAWHVGHFECAVASKVFERALALKEPVGSNFERTVAKAALCSHLEYAHAVASKALRCRVQQNGPHRLTSTFFLFLLGAV